MSAEIPTGSCPRQLHRQGGRLNGGRGGVLGQNQFHRRARLQLFRFGLTTKPSRTWRARQRIGNSMADFINELIHSGHRRSGAWPSHANETDA